jgi:membrane protease YdiL (CAAX protease family)
MATLVSALGYEELFGQGRGTVDGVVSMINLDLPTYLSLLAVTGVQAPLLEETVFRGFLLTSLTRFMPTWAAVLASAGAFGIAHLSLRDLPVLVALGTWMGFAYVRSKNLLTPMLIHGTWNSFVLSLLFYLTSAGVDVEKLLRELNG